ncbi:MAG: energy transducer TonB [Cephaloticoccus sp.]|nr:energy transducer TonB [Cephaloticoccus sp.]MCF7759223.1 energy transducer TonB [Cephaloticoccus sp.]
MKPPPIIDPAADPFGPKSAIALAYDIQQFAAMKIFMAAGIFALSLTVGVQAQSTEGGGTVVGGGTPAQGGPPISQRVYQGMANNIQVNERSAYVEPESKTPPYYPKQLRDAGIKGTVLVEVEVDRDNSVRNPRVIKSDHPELNMLAIETVLNWKYACAVVNGAMARSRIEVEVVFDPAAAEAERKVRLAKLRGKPSKELPELYQYDEAPDLVRKCPAVYPYDLLMKGKTGSATVSFIVDPTGNARGAEVKKASNPEFGAATAAMVEAWTFEPAMKDGKPCWALLTLEQKFNRISADAPIDEATGELVDDIKADRVKIYGFSEIDEKPRPIYQVGPELPEALRKSGKGATAQIEFIIDHHGRVKLPRIISSNEEAFGWAAATAVSRWVFSPAVKDGQPAYVRVRVPIAYEPPKKK